MGIAQGWQIGKLFFSKYWKIVLFNILGNRFIQVTTRILRFINHGIYINIYSDYILLLSQNSGRYIELKNNHQYANIVTGIILPIKREAGRYTFNAL